jgi:hypothetical protein
MRFRRTATVAHLDYARAESLTEFNRFKPFDLAVHPFARPLDNLDGVFRPVMVKTVYHITVRSAPD